MVSGTCTSRMRASTGAACTRSSWPPRSLPRRPRGPPRQLPRPTPPLASPRVLISFFLAVSPAQLDESLADLTSLPAPAGRRGGAGRARRSGAGRRRGRLVQRALDAGLGFHDRLFGRLVRHQHACRCVHHGADGFRLGQGLAAALVEVLGARGFLVGTGLRFGGGLGLGVFLDLCGGRLGSCLAVGHRRGFLGGFRCTFGHGGGLFRSLLAGGLGLLLGLFGELGLLAFARFGFFAQATLLDQFFFLAADQFGLAARLFLAAGEFGFIDARRGRGLGHFGLLHRLGRGRMPLIALDEGALLAHFDLDRAGAAGGVGLLDLAGRLLGQRDLLALGIDRAVAGLQETEQALACRLRSAHR